MKKYIFGLIAILAISLTSCKQNPSTEANAEVKDSTATRIDSTSTEVDSTDIKADTLK